MRSSSKPLGRKILYCSRFCQVADFANHKKVCGRKLADVTVVPTFTSSPARPRAPITAGITRHRGEIRFQNASWNAWYGTPSAPQKRVLLLSDPRNRAAFEAIRDRAIEERDVESVAAVMHALYPLADGVKVTRARIEAQMMTDFGLPIAELKKVGMTEARLAELGYRVEYRMDR